MSTRPDIGIGIALGAVGGFLLAVVVMKSATLRIDPVMNIGVLANAFVTLLLAIALQVYFSRTLSSTRAQKDLLIAQGEEVKVQAQAVRSLFLKMYEQGPTVENDRELLAGLRLLSMQLTALETASSQCFPKARHESLKSARNQYRRFRRCLGNRALARGTAYTPENHQEAEQAFFKLTTDLLLFSVALDR